MLATDRSESVYSYERDTADSSSCRADCQAKWKPVLAPSLARAQGEWSLLERSGERQWVFRVSRSTPIFWIPVTWSQQGSDEPGWDNAFTQVADSYPHQFQATAHHVGDVLADSEGKTIYIYHCDEDSQDQLGCDHPTERKFIGWPCAVQETPSAALNTGNMFWPVTMSRRPIAPGQLYGLTPAQVVSLHRSRKELFASGPTVIDRCTPLPVIHRPATSWWCTEWRGWRNALKAIVLRDDFSGTCDGNLSNAQMARLCPGAERLVHNLRCSGRVESGTELDYVMTDLFWSVYQTEDAQAECPGDSMTAMRAICALS